MIDMKRLYVKPSLKVVQMNQVFPLCTSMKNTTGRTGNMPGENDQTIEEGGGGMEGSRRFIWDDEE